MTTIEEKDIVIKNQSELIIKLMKLAMLQSGLVAQMSSALKLYLYEVAAIDPTFVNATPPQQPPTPAPKKGLRLVTDDDKDGEKVN